MFRAHRRVQPEHCKYFHLPPGCQRFLVLEPCAGDKSDPVNRVRCTFEYGRPDAIGAFVAIKNARGYPYFQIRISIDGKITTVSVALERCLRFLRHADKPVRIWTRHICIAGSHRNEMDLFMNRPFIEWMYAQASNSIDMVEYLWTLLDQKEIKRLQDGQAYWRKEWEFVPRKSRDPEYSPIWLGTRVPPTHPFQRYRYVPLDPILGEIRLVGLLPATHPAQDLEIVIYHEPLILNVHYIALSYTWDDSSGMVDILTSGGLLAIRESLKRSLIKLRRPQGMVTLWIDAICINQADAAERSHQIPRISDIFFVASRVVCYFEDPDGTGGIALELARNLQITNTRRTNRGTWEAESRQYSTNPELPFYSRCAALYRLATQEYFQCVWVHQELAFSTSPEIVCSTPPGISLQQFTHAVQCLKAFLEIDLPLVTHMVRLQRSLNLGSPDVGLLNYVCNHNYHRHLHKARSGDCNQQETPGILEVAILTRQAVCSVEHDKVFGILRLGADTAKLDYKVDYTKPAHEKFTEFSVSWCKAHGRLDIIGTSEMAPNDPSGYYRAAPSWSTNWSSHSRVSCLVRRDTLPSMSPDRITYQGGARYLADGNVEQSATHADYFSFDGATLFAKAAILDDVRSINLCRNDKAPDLKPEYRKLLSGKYDDIVQAVVATYTGDSIAAWPRTSENLEHENKPFHPKANYVCRPSRRNDYPNWPEAGDRSRYVESREPGYCRLDLINVSRMIKRGRRLIVTGQGYVGLAPEYIQEYMAHGKCVLAILATCSVPVILQESMDQKGTYKLLGTCFVQGWMDGDKLSQLANNAPASEFWSTDLAVKIKII